MSQVPEPLLESTLSGQSVVRVSAGSFHCGAITDLGVVYMWGENSHGQCGITGANLVSDPTPVNIVDADSVPSEVVRVQDVACGAQHTLALSTKHEVWAWGSGCQLGLMTTIFPVWEAQKVEHLTGKYVVEIACGEFHSLALVSTLPPSGSGQNSVSKCDHCKQTRYTMIDKDDHVIISDDHYCPLGVELNDSKSPSSTPKQILTHDLQNPLGLPDSFLCKETVVGPSSDERAPDTSSPRGERINTKSCVYPDKQAVKDYLKRISDQSILEQFEIPSRKGSRPPSRQTSLKDPSSTSLFSPMNTDGVEFSDSVHLEENLFVKAFNAQCSSDLVRSSLSDVSSEDSGINRVSPADFSASTSFEESFKSVVNDKLLEDKRSSSLSDILVEESEEWNRRSSLPSLLSAGVLHS